MITAAIILALIAALMEGLGYGIKEPWRKVIWAGIVVLLVLGIIVVVFPGLLPVRFGWY